MARKRLIWHLYPAFLGLGLAVLLAVSLYAAHSFHLFYYNQVTSDLAIRTHLLRSQITTLLQTGDYEKIDALCKSLYEKTNTRFTIILPDGRVIGDSVENPGEMQDHSDRPEFRESIEDGQGQSVRFSGTVGQNTMYLATRLGTDREITAVIRAAVPVTTLERELAAFYRRVLGAAVLLAVLAAFISLYLSKKISRPIEIMKASAKRFTAGDLNHTISLPNAAETADLAQMLNEMAGQLRSRINTITEDKNRIKAILSGMVEGVMAFDSAGTIIDMNKAAADYLGVDEKQSLGRSIEEIVRNPEFQQFIRDTLAGKIASRDVELAQDGQRYLQIHGAPLDSAGGQRGAVLVLHDITQIRRTDQIRRDFVANVSHELKTPITSIKGFVETLLEGSMDNPQEAGRFLEIIARHADRLDAIIDDLLSLARLEEEGEKRNLFFEEAYLKPVLASALELAHYKAKKKEISLELSCDAALTARMNAALIEQAVYNLIDNAVKYSPEHSRVEINATRQEDEILISVRDNGSGIEAQHLPRLFERFYVVDKSRSRKLGGTGLGLSIVKHISQVHDGRVTVESRLNKGCVFTIHLPAR